MYWTWITTANRSSPVNGKDVFKSKTETGCSINSGTAKTIGSHRSINGAVLAQLEPRLSVRFSNRTKEEEVSSGSKQSSGQRPIATRRN